MAIAGAIIAIDSSSLRSEGAMRPPSSLVFWSIVIVALGVVWQYIDAEIERRRVRRRTEVANEIAKIMFPIWYKIRTVTSDRKSQERLGVHVWMVPSWHWLLIPDWARDLTPETLRARLPTPRLWRACDYRLEDDQHDATDIRWRRDVGAIGLCWRTRRRQHFDLSQLWGNAQTPLTSAQWGALPPDERLGLTHEQYLRIASKYHAVMVIPIKKDSSKPGSRFIGCVVVDSLVDHPVNLNVRKVKSKAYTAARSISDRLSPISS